MDLENTWCKATEENLEALFATGASFAKGDRDKTWKKISKSIQFEDDDIFTVDARIILWQGFQEFADRKQVRAIGGKLEYMEDKPTQQEINEVIDKQLAEETKSEIIVIGGGADVKRNIKRYLDKNKTYEITIKEVISIN